MEPRRIEIINLEFIKIGPRHREIREEQVSSLVQSIAKIGLKTPITVRQASPDDDVILVAGAHRLEACKRLFMDEIEAFVIENDDEEAARMWEIAENLHRAELTKLERDEHIAEWISISNTKQKAISAAEAVGEDEANPDGEKLRKLSAVSKGGRGNEGGVRAAAREFKIDEKAARDAIKVSSLSADAKEAAKETGLDNNRSALLDAAAKSEEEQAERIREIAREKEMRRKLREMTAPDKKPATSEVIDCVVGEFRRLWLAASEEDRRTIYDIVKRHYASQSAA